MAGGVPERKGKRKSGVSGGSVDLAMLQKLIADVGRDVFAGRFDEPTPEVRAVPERARGFRVRVDLMYAKPPIWRRLTCRATSCSMSCMSCCRSRWAGRTLTCISSVSGRTGVPVPTSSPGSISAKATKVSPRTACGSTRVVRQGRAVVL